MERNLTRFIRALRSAGADISTAEAIDGATVIAITTAKAPARRRESYM